MILETQYDIGGTVYSIAQKTIEKISTCSFCDGKKLIIGYDKSERGCPNCHGKGFNTDYEHGVWQIEGPYTVAQVRIKYSDAEDQENEYMCWETGMPSGTVYHEEKLYGSKEEALEEAERRNHAKTSMEN